MIAYRHDKRRHILTFSNADLADMAELIWLLKHTPPPLGYQRKPLTTAQQRVVDNLYDVIQFPPEYGTLINSKTGQ